MDRRRRTCEIIDFVDFDKERKGHIVTQKLEHRIVKEFLDVAAGSGGEIIDAKNLVTLIEQPPAKMGAEKARSAGDQNPLLPQ